MNVIKRAKAPTPKFFKMLRNIGFVLAAVGGSIIAAPVVLPLTIISIGGVSGCSRWGIIGCKPVDWRTLL